MQVHFNEATESEKVTLFCTLSRNIRFARHFFNLQELLLAFKKRLPAQTQCVDWDDRESGGAVAVNGCRVRRFETYLSPRYDTARLSGTA